MLQKYLEIYKCQLKFRTLNQRFRAVYSDFNVPCGALCLSLALE